MEREGWTPTPIGRLVEKVTRPVLVEPTKTYQEIGIRSHGKGLFDKDNVTGADLGNKRVFWVEPDCLILNIVFAWEQAVGRTTVNDVGKIASHRFPMYKPRAGRSDVDYLTYLFKTPYGKHLLGLASPGGAGRNKTLGQSEFLKIVVSVPQIAEQRAIVNILQTWDRAVTTTNRLIEVNAKQKQALMQQLLSSSRKSFRRLRLQDMAFVNQRSLDSSTPPDYSFRYISLSDVQHGRIGKKLEQHEFSSAPSRAQRKVATGDILMSTVRPNLLGFARVGDSEADCIASTGFAVLSTKPEFDRDYLYHYLYSQHIIGQLTSIVVGSNYPAINSSDVENLVVFCPSFDQQVRIGRILNSYDAARDGLHRQRDLLRAEREDLVQQLLTGQRRVKLESTAAPVAVNG